MAAALSKHGPSPIRPVLAVVRAPRCLSLRNFTQVMANRGAPRHKEVACIQRFARSVMDLDTIGYFRHRENMERAAAQAATCLRSRRAHDELAQLYSALALQPVCSDRESRRALSIMPFARVLSRAGELDATTDRGALQRARKMFPDAPGELRQEDR